MSAVLTRCSKRLLLSADFVVTTAVETSSSPLHMVSAVAGHVKGHENRWWTGQNINTAQLRAIPFSTATPSVLSATAAGQNGGKTVRITDKCKERLREILEEKETFLRVSVEGGGCSGFQYKFEIDSKLCEDDVVVSRETGKMEDGRIGGDVGLDGNAAPLVVIDEMSLDLIKGSTLDYETELIRSTFRVVNNPLAEQGCSCGASFNMKI